MIAIVGGGITGLAIGWELMRRGDDFLVLEATERAGGVIRSATVEGRVLDWGPQRSRLSPYFATLTEDLGLLDERITAPPGLGVFIYRDGSLRRAPTSIGDLLQSDIVPLPGKLRFMLEPLSGPARPGESVADFFRRKIGLELYETLVGPLFGGLYGSDPADMDVDRTLAEVLDRLGVRRSLLAALVRRSRGGDFPAAFSFRTGMHALPAALADRLGDRVRFRQRVGGLRPSGSGWEVETESGPVDAEHVIVTAPADATAGLLHPVAPKTAESLRALDYNPLALVHLHAETDLEGMGFQVALSEPDTLLRGVTFNDALFPETRSNVYTAFLGGARHPEVRDLARDRLADAAVEGFRRTTGFDARPIASELTRMPAWDTSWRALDEVSLPAGLHLAGNWWSRPGLPGRFAEARRIADRVTRGGAAAPAS